MSGGEVGLGVGSAGDGSVGDWSRFRHTVFEKGVHFFTSSSPDLHLNLEIKKKKIIQFKSQ